MNTSIKQSKTNYLISPRESFVGINRAIKGTRERNHPPAHLFKCSINFAKLVFFKFHLLTVFRRSPPSSKPPIVP